MDDHSRNFLLCFLSLVSSSQQMLLCAVVHRKPVHSMMTLLSCFSLPPASSSLCLSLTRLHIVNSPNLSWQRNLSQPLIIHVALLWIPFRLQALFWQPTCLVWSSSFSSWEVNINAYGQDSHKDRGGDDWSEGGKAGIEVRMTQLKFWLPHLIALWYQTSYLFSYLTCKMG